MGLLEGFDSEAFVAFWHGFHHMLGTVQVLVLVGFCFGFWGSGLAAAVLGKELMVGRRGA